MHKILLAEDNESNRDMLSRRLIKRGYEVAVAIDGEEAIKLVSTVCPHLILMDMRMPNVDGWEATKQLKSQPDTCEIPIIALTADARPADKEKALSAGCDDYDTKPVEFPRLLSKIRKLLDLENSDAVDQKRLSDD